MYCEKSMYPRYELSLMYILFKLQNEGCTDNSVSDSKISLPYFEEVAACCDISIKKIPLKKECNLFQVILLIS